MTNPTPENVDQQPATDPTTNLGPDPAPGIPPPTVAPTATPPGRTNVLAIVALVCGFVFWPAGIWLGHKAHREIEETGENGRGLATAGLVLSYLGLASAILLVIFAVAGAGHAATFGMAHGHLLH